MAKVYKHSRIIYEEERETAERENRQMRAFRMRLFDKNTAQKEGANVNDIHEGRCLLPTELGCKQLAVVNIKRL